jgi:hypothetical protein
MSTTTHHPETRIILSNISRATFEALSTENDQHGTRFSYDRGILEITSPSAEHKWLHRLHQSAGNAPVTNAKNWLPSP